MKTPEEWADTDLDINRLENGDARLLYPEETAKRLWKELQELKTLSSQAKSDDYYFNSDAKLITWCGQDVAVVERDVDIANAQRMVDDANRGCLSSQAAKDSEAVESERQRCADIAEAHGQRVEDEQQAGMTYGNCICGFTIRDAILKEKEMK